MKLDSTLQVIGILTETYLALLMNWASSPSRTGQHLHRIPDRGYHQHSFIFLFDGDLICRFFSQSSNSIDLLNSVCR